MKGGERSARRREIQESCKLTLPPPGLSSLDSPHAAFGSIGRGRASHYKGSCHVYGCSVTIKDGDERFASSYVQHLWRGAAVDLEVLRALWFYDSSSRRAAGGGGGGGEASASAATAAPASSARAQQHLCAGKESVRSLGTWTGGRPKAAARSLVVHHAE